MKETMFCVYADFDKQRFAICESTPKGRESFQTGDDDDGFWTDWTEDLGLEQMLQILKDRCEV